MSSVGLAAESRAMRLATSKFVPASRRCVTWAVLYVATADGAISIPDQRASVVAFATRRGLQVLGAFEDRLATASYPLRRPALECPLRGLCTFLAVNS